MDWLKQIAPLLGTALAGPLGGAAAAFIADKLGVEEKTVEAVTDALATTKLTPEQIQSVKLAEIDFQKFLKQNQIDLEQIHASDRKDARSLLATTRAKTPAALTWMIVVSVLALEGVILFAGTPERVDPMVLGRIMGTLDTAFGLVLAYWFGTTSGSATKTEMLAMSSPSK